MAARRRPRSLGVLLLLLTAATSLAFVGCASFVRVAGPLVAPGALWRVSCDEQLVALTIDDGPVPDTTERLLEVLRSRGVHATFFLIGERAEANPALVEAIVADGHEIANHTWSERMTVRLDAEETAASIRDTHAVLSRYADVVWLRPGTAFYDDDVLATAQMFGYGLALGDTFPYDTFVSASAFHQWYILQAVRPGSIIVLHDAHGRGARAARTLSSVLPRLQEQGFRVLSLSELVSHPACQAHPAPDADLVASP